MWSPLRCDVHWQRPDEAVPPQATYNLHGALTVEGQQTGALASFWIACFSILGPRTFSLLWSVCRSSIWFDDFLTRRAPRREHSTHNVRRQAGKIHIDWNGVRQGKFTLTESSLPSGHIPPESSTQDMLQLSSGTSAAIYTVHGAASP
jgi:hypothetical protein